MTAQEIRKKYLEYFEAKGHKIIPRALLVPQDDPTTLFTGSGMQPLVPYLLGQPHPQGSRLVDSQTCFRAEDMDEVGDNRQHAERPRYTRDQRGGDQLSGDRDADRVGQRFGPATLHQPPRPHRCDHDQRRRRRHRQRESNVDGQFRSGDHQHDHAGRQDGDGLPAPV